MKSFKELGLSQNLLKIIEESGFTEPTEIQEKVLPLALAGHDIIGESATGSGKTLAFGAPIIEHVQPGKGIQALILTPTRELAQQDSKALSIFAKYYHLKITAVYGGVSLIPQIRGLERTEIVVGTPGRILDHLSRRTIDLSRVRFLVLDEADRMLDMGFLEEVTRIIERCPRDRQTFLFSATISGQIIEISKKYMRNAKEVSAESYVDPSKLEQVFYDVPPNEKFSLLVHLLKQENSKLVMVFCNTKRNADFIGKSLNRNGFDALALHGDLRQNQRSRVLEEFHKSSKFILVCTDVAARGLDIPHVSHVYNYDSPKTSIEYIHRVGRTARAGKKGKAITILAERDYENFNRVISDQSLNIQKTELPQFERVFIKSPSRREDSRRGERGREERGVGDRGRGGGYGRSPRSFSRDSRFSHGRRRFSHSHENRCPGPSRPRESRGYGGGSGYIGESKEERGSFERQYRDDRNPGSHGSDNRDSRSPEGAQTQRTWRKSSRHDSENRKKLQRRAKFHQARNY